MRCNDRRIAMTCRRFVRRSIASLTLFAIIYATSVSRGAQENPRGWDQSRTVTVEGDVIGFVYGDSSFAKIILKTETRPFLSVEWVADTRSIPENAVQAGNRVTITGQPWGEDYPLVLLRTITRPSDGWKSTGVFPGLAAPNTAPTQPQKSAAA